MQLHAPAKINLFLKVLGKRTDNYHDLYTLMCPISLYDLISLHFGKKKISVICSDSHVPKDETNLACKAARRFFEATQLPHGIQIIIDKKIPAKTSSGIKLKHIEG